MIAIADYGLGNVRAFQQIFHRLNIPSRTVSCAEDLRGCSKLILPGVGSFDWAMSRLLESRMREAMEELVLERGVPVLGVCVGMQMLFESSEEGDRPGLGWIEGTVRRLPANGVALPHMGWNDVRVVRDSVLLEGLSDARFYFLHSYFVSPTRSVDVAGEASYGLPFAAAVDCGNIFGTQFHPEKSHDWGVALLRNFAEL